MQPAEQVGAQLFLDRARAGTPARAAPRGPPARCALAASFRRSGLGYGHAASVCAHRPNWPTRARWPPGSRDRSAPAAGPRQRFLPPRAAREPGATRVLPFEVSRIHPRARRELSRAAPVKVVESGFASHALSRAGGRDGPAPSPPPVAHSGRRRPRVDRQAWRRHVRRGQPRRRCRVPRPALLRLAAIRPSHHVLWQFGQQDAAG